MAHAPSNDPLHGLTLKTIVTRLVEHYGFETLAEMVPIRCFQFEPSINSSLKFLRLVPWARNKVEQLYLGTRGSWNPREAGSADAQAPGDIVAREQQPQRSGGFTTTRAPDDDLNEPE